MTLLSIDPGKDHFGWAVLKGERLTHCGRMTGWNRRPTQLLLGPGHYDVAVIELPQVYQQRRWKGDPNDLIQVAVTVGSLLASIHAREAVLLVKPHEWKGTVPKRVMGNRIKGKLNVAELQLVEGCGVPKGKLHDVVDAIGLGLWKVGRLGK